MNEPDSVVLPQVTDPFVPTPYITRAARPELTFWSAVKVNVYCCHPRVGSNACWKFWPVSGLPLPTNPPLGISTAAETYQLSEVCAGLPAYQKLTVYCWPCVNANGSERLALPTLELFHPIGAALLPPGFGAFRLGAAYGVGV